MMRIADWCRVRPLRVGWTSASVAAIVVTTVHVWPRTSDRGPTAIITEGPFRDTLVARGAVSSARMASYGSTIPGVQAKILELVPEGTAVEPGQVLVRFDATPFEDVVARESAGVAEAQAEVLRASETLHQEQVRATVETEAARADVVEAETALANERDGKGPLAVAEAEAAAAEAARELASTRAAANDMTALLAQGFVTRLEADRATQTARQAEDRDRLARLKLQTLRGFEQPAALEKSRAGVSAASLNLSGTTASAASRMVERQASLTLAQARLGESRTRLAHARDDVARTVVRSVGAGLVVYEELFFGTEKRKPQPGDEVWPNQPIVAVPDSTQVVVNSRIREVDLHKIRLGAPVVVTVDAYPGVRLAASVALVGALAEEDSTRAAGEKFFPLTVRIAEQDARLRTGMTARVEIIVAALDRALLVPIQALIERPDGSILVHVVTGGRVTSELVTVAARNSETAVVTSGLASGNAVELVDPARSLPHDHDQP